MSYGPLKAFKGNWSVSTPSVLGRERLRNEGL
jgi:hypothetical protein